MYVRTAITATARHTRQGRQHKERREQASWLDCLTTQNRSCQVLSMAWPRSGAKHHWQKLTAPIDSKQQSNKFLATNVTKKLDHYNTLKSFISRPGRSMKKKGRVFCQRSWTQHGVLSKWWDSATKMHQEKWEYPLCEQKRMPTLPEQEQVL